MNPILRNSSQCTFAHYHLTHCAIEQDVGHVFFIGAAFGIGQRQVELCLQTERLRFVGFTVQGTRHITLKNCCKQKRTWMWDAGCGMWETSILSQLEPKSRRSSLHLATKRYVNMPGYPWLPWPLHARGNMVGWKPMTCSQLPGANPIPQPWETHRITPPV